MLKFFWMPWANAGTKTAVPNDAQPDGSVSYEEGYTVDYEQDPDIDPVTAKDVPRDKYNQSLFDITAALKELQSHAVPDFITSALNDGAPWAYSKYDWVRWNNGVETLIYESLVNSNTALPSDTTKWIPLSTSGFKTGMTVRYYGSTLLSGWIWPDGGTIGNATSGGTNRANADTEALFTLLWEAMPNSILPIQTSSGAASTRGVSAAADYAANKRLPVPDERGRVSVGRDDMGGTAANRVTSLGSSITGTQLGSSGGVETVALTDSQNGQHSHGSGSFTAASAGAHVHAIETNIGSGSGSERRASGETNTQGANVSTLSAGAHTHTISGTSGTSGTGAPHQNMPPAYICNVLLKL